MGQLSQLFSISQLLQPVKVDQHLWSVYMGHRLRLPSIIQLLQQAKVDREHWRLVNVEDLPLRQFDVASLLLQGVVEGVSRQQIVIRSLSHRAKEFILELDCYHSII